jgi:CheY-like chemotaxis protein
LVSSALRIYLQEAGGFRVSVAESVAEAVRVATGDAVDVMFLDLKLADGDGLRVLDALRQAGRTPRVTAALTGADDATTQARCAAAGCRAVLVKPVPPRELVRLVGAWLS